MKWLPKSQNFRFLKVLRDVKLFSSANEIVGEWQEFRLISLPPHYCPSKDNQWTSSILRYDRCEIFPQEIYALILPGKYYRTCHGLYLGKARMQQEQIGMQNIYSVGFELSYLLQVRQGKASSTWNRNKHQTPLYLPHFPQYVVAAALPSAPRT